MQSWLTAIIASASAVITIVIFLITLLRGRDLKEHTAFQRLAIALTILALTVAVAALLYAPRQSDESRRREELTSSQVPLSSGATTAAPPAQGNTPATTSISSAMKTQPSHAAVASDTLRRDHAESHPTPAAAAGKPRVTSSNAAAATTTQREIVADTDAEQSTSPAAGARINREPESTNDSSAKPANQALADIDTTAGRITIEFFSDLAPHHVQNFIQLARSGFYDGTKFHRVIPGFMVQGGDPNTIEGPRDTWGTGGSGKRLDAEFSDKHHARGIVSMARSIDPNSASSQFFIMVADNGKLDGKYSVFGRVVAGMNVADEIANRPRDSRGRPLYPASIIHITIRPAE